MKLKSTILIAILVMISTLQANATLPEYCIPGSSAEIRLIYGTKAAVQKLNAKLQSTNNIDEKVELTAAILDRLTFESDAFRECAKYAFTPGTDVIITAKKTFLDGFTVLPGASAKVRSYGAGLNYFYNVIAPNGRAFPVPVAHVRAAQSQAEIEAGLNKYQE